MLSKTFKKVRGNGMYCLSIGVGWEDCGNGDLIFSDRRTRWANMWKWFRIRFISGSPSFMFQQGCVQLEQRIGVGELQSVSLKKKKEKLTNCFLPRIKFLFNWLLPRVLVLLENVISGIVQRHLSSQSLDFPP